MILFLGATIFSDAQAPSIQWQKRYGGSLGENFIDGINTRDGGFIFAGGSRSNDGEVNGNYGNVDVWVVKVDNAGNIQWENNYGGSNIELAEAIDQTKDGGYIIAGNTQSNDFDVTGYHGNVDYWIIKIDSTGNLIWQKCLGGSSYETSSSVHQTNDGGYIVGGVTLSNDGDVSGLHNNLGNFDFWVVKLDSMGNLQWQHCFGSDSPEEHCKVVISKDNKYVASGFSSGMNNGDVNCFQHGGGDYWVVKLDTNGIILSQNCFGGSMGEIGYAIDTTFGSGFIIAGASNSSDGDVTGVHGINPYRPDYWIVKTDSSLNLQWEKCLGGGEIDVPSQIQQTNDSGYIVTGYTESNDGDVTGNHSFGFGQDFWTVKLDRYGNLEWQRASGGSANELENAVIQTLDSGFLIIGGTTSTDGDLTGISSHGDGDAWVVKLFPSSTGVNLSINPFNDFNFYLNPINNNLYLNFSAKGNEQIRVELIDITGRILISQPLSIKNGFNNKEVYIGELSNGVYIVSMVTDKRRVGKKLIKN
ncbi:MAG: T9SS type A sorting domain-containing protein [Bacteroidota bacterium]